MYWRLAFAQRRAIGSHRCTADAVMNMLVVLVVLLLNGLLRLLLQQRLLLPAPCLVQPLLLVLVLLLLLLTSLVQPQHQGSHKAAAMGVADPSPP
jgi:hypothetical protein